MDFDSTSTAGLRSRGSAEAEAKVGAFGNRFGPAHVWFACHAAMPLALTPDLLYAIWANFQDLEAGFLQETRLLAKASAPASWIVVADLLMSDLCQEVGHELYAMDPEVREVLLQRLEDNPRFGPERLRAVADFILRQTEGALRSEDEELRDWGQVQRWTALAYVQPELAAKELAEGLAGGASGLEESGTGDFEAVRLTRVVQRLVVPLEQGSYQPLVSYARGMEAWQLGDEAGAKEALGQLPGGPQDLWVAGVALAVPEAVKPRVVEQEVNEAAGLRGRRLTRRRLLQGAGLATVGLIGGVALDRVRKKPASNGTGVDVPVSEVVGSNPAVEPPVFDPPQFQSITTEPFSFEMVTVDERGRVISRSTRQAQEFREALSNQVVLEMVAIPGGEFEMGAQDGEEGADDTERPRHPVTVPPFFMGKYPVTQAQYEAVMGKNPSSFKGADRPVESVSWNDAVAFCQKLSQQTGREYRLPSEAEWEYACRAGTTTPFHFGETITTDLANYDGTDGPNWSGSYGKGPKGEYRQETTPVDQFGVANAFGLYDMHGNVWEWCQDTWHDNYNNAPIDGSARIESDNRSQSRLLRGGSWLIVPGLCRSANRNGDDPDNRNDVYGFRVVLSAART